MTKLYFEEFNHQQLSALYNNCEEVRKICRKASNDAKDYFVNLVKETAPESCAIENGNGTCSFNFVDGSMASADAMKEVMAWMKDPDTDIYTYILCVLNGEEEEFYSNFEKAIKYKTVLENDSINIKEKDAVYMFDFSCDFIRTICKVVSEAMVYSDPWIYENIDSEGLLDGLWDEYFKGFYVEDGILHKEVHYIEDYKIDSSALEAFC